MQNENERDELTREIFAATVKLSDLESEVEKLRKENEDLKKQLAAPAKGAPVTTTKFVTNQ